MASMPSFSSSSAIVRSRLRRPAWPLLTTAPWFLAGLYAYLCLAFCLLEPQRKARLLGVMLAAGICPLPACPGSSRSLRPQPALLRSGPACPNATGLLLPALNYRHRRIE